MNRLLKLADIFKIAVNKENERLRGEFSEKFTEENIGKANSFADQWYRAFYQTSLYEQWKFLNNLNDVLSFIRENKDSVERAERKEEASVLAQLIELFPEQKEDLQKLNDAFLSWVKSRYINPPQGLMEHPIGDAMPTLLNYQEALPGLRQKFNENQTYRELFEAEIPEANHPGDLKNLSSDQMELAKNLADRNRGLHTIVPSDYKPKIFLGQFGPWKLWLPETELDSIAIAKVNPVTQKPHTSWCTARNSGENLFYNYNRFGRMLFYAIKDGASPENDEDYQSIMMAHGLIEYDGDYGGTINRDQKGRYEEDHKRLFGDQFEPIYNTINRMTFRLRDNHPSYIMIQHIVEQILEGSDEAFEKAKSEGKINKKILKAINEEFDNYHLDEFSDIDFLLNNNNIALTNKFPGLKIAIINSKDIPVDVLKKFIKDENKQVKKEAIARLAEIEGLADLSEHQNDEDVREQIAKSKDASPEKLDSLSSDNSEKIRVAVAGNTSTPPEVLSKLSKDPSELVMAAVAGNTFTPPDTLEELSDSDYDAVLIAVAGNVSAPQRVLKTLSYDPLEEARCAVA